MVRYYKNLKSDEKFFAGAVMLEGYGMPKEYAAFFADKPNLDPLSELLVGVSEDLSVIKLTPFQIESIFSLVPENRWPGLSKRLKEINGWFAFMPTEWEETRSLGLATLLGRINTPPKSLEEIVKRCENCQENVLRLLVSEDMDAKLLDDFYEFIGYAKKPYEPAEKINRVPIIQSEPHEQVEVPGEVAAHLLQIGMDPDDIVRALIYGLKLYSPKGARGGKYFGLECFRKNTERALLQGDTEVSKRRKEVEEFLLKNGVIATYKQGDVIRLNIKEDGGSTKPTDLGEKIINLIIAWMKKFQRETAVGSV